MMFINIYLKGRYSANALSNFYSHSFAFEGFKKITCMEAFLQSLKFEDLNNQRYMLYLNAKEAKIIGGAQSWD